MTDYKFVESDYEEESSNVPATNALLTIQPSAPLSSVSPQMGGSKAALRLSRSIPASMEKWVDYLVTSLFFYTYKNCTFFIILL